MRDKVTKITRSMKRITALLTLFLAMTFISCKSGKTVGENPFFAEWETPYGVPPFDKIEPEHFLPAIERGMSLHEAEIDAIVTNRDEPTFENVILAFDNSGQMLAQTSLVFGMLCAAQNTPEMQALQEQAMPRLTAHYDKILLNDALFERVKAVYDNRATFDLDAEQSRLLEKTYRSFVRSGALLGADDKAGVAEIITLAAYLKEHPEIKHGQIQIGLGPDEEIGTGADHFDVEDFGADFAYTIDGGPLGELEDETFNAAQAEIDIQGKDVHTGTAKDTMVNAIQVGIDLQNQLPLHDRPEKTADREGFYHLYKFDGTVDHARLVYLIRDHDKKLFEARKEALRAIVRDLNASLGEDRISLNLYDQYYNLKDALKGHEDVIELAKKAMEDLGIKPDIYPVRGGTDGSTISYLGLPTPNLFAGGENMHSRFEYVSVQTM